MEFTATNNTKKRGWIYNGFIDRGADIPSPDGRYCVDSQNQVNEYNDACKQRESGAISWAHNMSVDLRMGKNYRRNGIAWEVFEDTQVQILERDGDFYYVKVEGVSDQEKISEEMFNREYARLYVGITDLGEMKQYEAGIG